LRDAANHIRELPKAEDSAPEWQAAMEALILVAETGGPYDVGQDRRHAGVEPSRRRVFNPDRKDHHWGKRKLKRDQ